MSIFATIYNASGASETREILFDDGGDSEQLLTVNDTGKLEAYYIRTIAFPNRVRLFYAIGADASEQSPVMLEHAMECVVYARSERVAEYFRNDAEMRANGYHRCPDGIYRQTPSNGMFDGVCNVCEYHNYLSEASDNNSTETR